MLGVDHLEDEGCTVTIDRRRMPVLIVTWRGKATERMTRVYFDQLTELCRKAGKQKFVTIADARAASAPTAGIRKLLSEQVELLRPVTEPVLLCSVVIVRTALMRGALTAIQWAVRHETRVVAVNDFTAAFDVACGVLRRAEIAPPVDMSVPLYDLSVRK